MARRAMVLSAAVAAVLSVALAATPSAGVAATSCTSGYVTASLSTGTKCLRSGEFCKPGNAEYHRYGFNCPASGHLVAYTSGSATGGSVSRGSSTSLGRTVLLGRRLRTSVCHRGVEPDRRCSPGAYYSDLTKAVICSTRFRTSSVRNVPDSEKFAVEREYGMVARHYGREIEIDHIVSLELGGSNDIANLFPEPGSEGASYRVKDELENRLHDMVCAGAISLRIAQQQIARDWVALYRRVIGAARTG